MSEVGVSGRNYWMELVIESVLFGFGETIDRYDDTQLGN